MDAVKLEKEIVERFRLLSPQNRLRVLTTLQGEVQEPRLTWEECLKQAKAVRGNNEAQSHVSASDLVNEAREERDADILRSLGFGDSTSDSSS